MNFSNLSPSDFETLAADVLSAVHSVAFERYGEGPDGGIDCRHVTEGDDVWIGQAKRYRNVADLLRAMPKEQQKMQVLNRPPSRYFLVTACSLTPGNKDAILKAMQPFIKSTVDIYGADDLEARLHQYPAIYRKHHRLWLHSVEQLTQYLNQAHYARADMVHERLLTEAQTYVVPPAQQTIDEQLARHHSCLIVGDPGIGKSTTAGQVALQQQIERPQAELIWLDDRNFNQALQLIRPHTDQILVMDDFLGATFLDDSGVLAFKRDWQALLFKAKQAGGQLKLIFTTRHYILEQALTQFGDNHAAITQLCRQAVHLKHTSAKLRAELVYQLIHAAGFTEAQLVALVQEKLYWPLIKTTDFSPRLIEMFCEKLTSVPAEQLKTTIEQGVEGQQQLWQQVFKRQSPEAQTLVYLCALAGNYANATELKRAFNTLYPQVQGRMAPPNGFDQALTELEPTFITTAHYLDSIWVSPANPSLVDYLQRSTADNSPLIDALIQSLEHFDWGLKNFKIVEGSSSPVALRPKQRDALIDKLLELLAEPGNNLLQAYQGGSIQWFNRPDTFGSKLTQLWRVVMGDDQQARDLVSKLKNRLGGTAHWRALYQQSGMAELLDITRYLPREQQPMLWALAIHNLNNSQDAAALAEFYRFNSDARKALKPKQKQLKRRILAACECEIDSIDDPDLLNEVLGDVYRIEEALSLDLRPLIHEIYDKAFESEEGIGDYDDLHTTYYQSPEVPDELAEIERQLRGMVAEVDERYRALCAVEPYARTCPDR